MYKSQYMYLTQEVYLKKIIHKTHFVSILIHFNGNSINGLTILKSVMTWGHVTKVRKKNYYESLLNVNVNAIVHFIHNIFFLQ